jgi:hypothetical protein
MSYYSHAPTPVILQPSQPPVRQETILEPETLGGRNWLVAGSVPIDQMDPTNRDALPPKEHTPIFSWVHAN